MKHSIAKTKAPALVLAILMVLLLLTGCTKTPATTSDFLTVAENKGYLSNDVMSQFSGYSDTVKEATVAAPASIAFKLEFYVLADETKAKDFFETNRQTLEANKTGVYSSSSVNGKNYQSFSLTAGGQYMFIERVGTTVLFVSPTDSANKDEIEAFIKELKY